MQSTNRKNLLILPVAAALSMVFSIAADAASGKFQFVSGEVKIKLASGEIRNAAKGMEINEGDMVLSGMPGLAQLKMEDGGTIVVRPNTRFTVQTYRFNGKEDGTERATYKLDQGSVRAITGQIGKTNKQNYLIQTPTASIGVRGTDHEPAYIPKKEDIEYLNAPPGTYDKVNVGETYIETQGGLVVVKPNSVGFAEDEFAVPTILPALPAFYNQYAATGGTTIAGNLSNSFLLGPNLNKNTMFGPDDVASFQNMSALPQPLNTDAGTNLSTRNIAAPLPPVTQLTRADLGVYTQVLNNGFTKIEQTRKLSFGTSNATIAESGSNAGLAVNWGRWENGYTVEGGNITGSLHVINAARFTSSSELAALPITATYNMVNATRPTDELGRVGDLTKLCANVNFATQKINDYAILANNSGRQWTANGNGTFVEFVSSNNGLKLSGLCNGCQVDVAGNQITSSANGFAKGAFIGSQAQGMITTYGIQSNDKGISGAAVLQR